jgi:16S rRNA (cytosine1402-N4)-methyltransferase
LGAGGHAAGILEASSPDGKLLGLDVDPQALTLARQCLAPFGKRAFIRRASYVDLRIELDMLSWDAVDGVLFDLGLSSMQVDTPERGFSFQKDAALDMRFDPEGSLKAADLVNNLSQVELSNILFKYGEERKANKIARAIVRARPVETTGQLAEIVALTLTGHGRSTRKEKARKARHLHPATRTFQALRIAVNKELDAIETSLPKALAALAPGGRLAVIAFHSLEDRIVKQFFRRESRDCICPPRQPICTCDHRAGLVEITRRPLRASPEEIIQNPRARSARLRVAEKLEISKLY